MKTSRRLSFRKKIKMKLTFNSDAHFLIGHTHFTAGKPCQDYALSNDENNSSLIVVSDGCSKGGLTDVGSRIIAHTTIKVLKECVGLSEKLAPEVITLARQESIKQASMTLGLHSSDLLATCLYAQVSSEGGLVHLQGDGVIAFKYCTGEVKIYRYDWENNTPFYPAYNENLSGFIYAHGGNLEAKSLTKESWVLEADGSFVKLPSEEIALQSGIQGITIPISSAEVKELDHVAIFTDGVTQVEKIDWKEAVASLLAFKNFNGEFAKRRMIRFMKDAQAKGRGPLDDISYAVITINQEEEENTNES